MFALLILNVALPLEFVFALYVLPLTLRVTFTFLTPFPLLFFIAGRSDSQLLRILSLDELLAEYVVKKKHLKLHYINLRL